MSKDFLCYNFLEGAVFISVFFESLFTLFTLFDPFILGQSSLPTLGVYNNTKYVFGSIKHSYNSAGVLVLCLIRKPPIALVEENPLSELLGLSTNSNPSSLPKDCSFLRISSSLGRSSGFSLSILPMRSYSCLSTDWGS